jgi:hypothetical protein
MALALGFTRFVSCACAGRACAAGPLPTSAATVSAVADMRKKRRMGVLRSYPR